MRRIVFIALFLAACGGSTGGSAVSVTGQVDGAQVVATSAAAIVVGKDTVDGDHLKGTFDAPVCGDRPDAGPDAGCR